MDFPSFNYLYQDLFGYHAQRLEVTNLWAPQASTISLKIYLVPMCNV